MIPSSLMNDLHVKTAFHKGEKRVKKVPHRNSIFAESAENLGSFTSVIPSTVTSVAPSKENSQEKAPISSINVSTTVAAGNAPENAFQHRKTASRVNHIIKQPSQRDDLAFVYSLENDNNGATKPKVFKDLKTPYSPGNLLYTNLETEDMRLVTASEMGADARLQTNQTHVSLAPTNRKEVAILKHTMIGLLRDMGVADETQDYPTDMHAFLSVIQEEQKVYDTVLQEIIRQVTINMAERGEILAEVRNRYSVMFAKVPKHVRHLHTELVAQRKLNKRLTEELLKSKETMSQLVAEVELVRKHDAHVSRQAQDTQEKLVSILTQSDNNDEILEEYHKLYKMQRDRLEDAITTTEQEKRMWIDAAIKLAIRIGTETGVSELLDLHNFEQARSRSANHMIKIIGDTNHLDLSMIERKSEDSRSRLISLSKSVVEEDMVNIETLTKMEKDIQFVLRSFDANETLDSEAEQRLLKAFHMYDVKSLADHLHKWVEQISLVAVRFTSDRDLTLQEDVVSIRSAVESWVEAGMKLTKRNEKTTNGKDYKVLTENLSALNVEIDIWLRKIEMRVSGEDGIASHVISLQNQLEDRYTIYSARDFEKPILPSERAQIKESFHSWIDICGKLISTLANTTEKEQTRVPLHVDNWLQKILDQITTDTGMQLFNIKMLGTKRI